MRLREKIAVITGGASGIGAAGTIAFATEGATVIILDVNEKAGMLLARKLNNVMYINADISEEDKNKILRENALVLFPQLRENISLGADVLALSD